MLPNRFAVALFALVAGAAAGAQGSPLPRGTIAGDAKPLPTAKALPAAPAAPTTPPASWTQTFNLGTGERTSFGFAVGKPGPIVVNARWTGAPLTISLVRPDGTSIDQQGTGSVTLQYTATADDVKKGLLWSVNVRPAQQARAFTRSSALVVIDKPVKLVTSGAATGSVSTQHPAGDLKLAQAEMKAKADLAQAALLQAKQVPTGLSSVLATQQAALQTQEKSRQTTILASLKSKLPVQTSQQMATRLAVPQKTSAGAAPATPPATGTSAQAVTAAGSATPATVAVDPTIGSLSAASGQPGDPILILGSGFSGSQGEVHFIIANGKDVTAPVTGWNDTQIFAAVPDASGIQGFNGQVYVKRGTAASKYVAFRFNPTMELRTLTMSNDRSMVSADPYGLSIGIVQRADAGNIFGSKGDDQFFVVTTLANGWTVNRAYLTGYVEDTPVWTYGSANAYISESRQGTDSPYLKVHWWRDGWSNVIYKPHVVIIGPKGVPHF